MTNLALIRSPQAQVLAALALAALGLAPRALWAQDAVPAPVPAQVPAQAAAAAAAAAKTIELDAKVPSLLMLDPTSKVWSLQVTSKSRLDV